MERVKPNMSPSNSSLWIHCPGSVKRTKTPSGELIQYSLERIEQSDYEAEGIRAHKMAQVELEYFKQYRCKRNSFTRTNEEKFMKKYIDIYTDTVIQCFESLENASLYVEEKIDLTRIIPGTYGIIDCLVVSKNEIHIFDLKYGQGKKVRASDNSQLLIYAVGVVYRFYVDYSTKIYIHIVAPRQAGKDRPVDDVLEYSVEEIHGWCNGVLLPAVEKVLKDEPEYKAGQWCKQYSCPLYKDCRAYVKYTLGGDELNRIIEILNDTTTNELKDDEKISLFQILEGWEDGCQALEEEVLDMMKNGKEVPGYRLEHKKTYRQITNEDIVKELLLSNGYTDIYRETKIASPAQLEKRIGEEELNRICGEYIKCPKGDGSLRIVQDWEQEDIKK